MALDTEVRGKVTDRLAADVALPRMFPARQRLDDAHIQPQDIPAAVRSELGRDAVMQRIRPGMSVAITAGSRGVTNYAAVIRAIADFVKMRGAHPFVFPAMGSHGGATARGSGASSPGTASRRRPWAARSAPPWRRFIWGIRRRACASTGTGTPARPTR